VDGTREILDRFARRGRLTLIDEVGEAFMQDRWMTRMARLAATDLGADWIINSDADEFWWPTTTTLKQALARVPPDVNVVVVSRQNAVPRPEGAAAFERLIYFQTEPRNLVGAPLPPKVCHRASPHVNVAFGNHAVRFDGVATAAAAVDLEILHFPVRSYAQLESKIRHGTEALCRNPDVGADVGTHWRALYRELRAGKLRGYYDTQVLDDRTLGQALADGRVYRNTRLRDHIRRGPSTGRAGE
jgi:hypothetical protein